MAKRTTKTVVANVTKEKFEDALAQYAMADAKEASIQAKMDEKITKIREQYSSELAELAQSKEENFEVVQVYSTENAGVLFAKKKSFETAHGLIGFRTGTPKLKLRRGFQWGAVLELLKVKAASYVRTKEEVDKERLLIDRENAETQILMKEVGVDVDQDEKFFIDLKKEEAVA